MAKNLKESSFQEFHPKSKPALLSAMFADVHRDSLVMKSRPILTSFLVTVLLTLLLGQPLAAQGPLRVFIKSGPKTHGPGQHDHPRFLQEWRPLLRERGVQASGGEAFPSAAQLAATDVVILHSENAMQIAGEERERFETYLKRGGGLVVIHAAVLSGEETGWAKRVQGAAWIPKGDKPSKYYEGEVGIYVVNPDHPITRGLSNFDWKDEIYYDLDLSADVNVLATSFHTVFVIAPQIWTLEKTWEGGSAPHRTFVSLPGHEYASFNTPHYRAVLLRGIAWAGKRSNVDEFCQPAELASLKYPEGGPIAPEKAAARLNLHPEFDLQLVASEPLVEKVISCDWDASGRLWVAETPEYPGGRTIHKNDKPIALWNVRNPGLAAGGQGTDPRTGRDRVSWLEDTNGDGLMDRKTIFHEGLELVTSIVFYKDGVIAAQAPDILWIRDTDKDGKADRVEKLFTGFGNFDTHAVINNFRWGLDGWVYGAIGYSAGSPTSPDGSKKFGRLTAGVFRFRPDGSAVEQVVSGSCNTWGFDVAPGGELFYSTATCGEHLLHVVMPEKVLARGSVGGVRGSEVIPDHQKVFPAVHHTRPAYVQIDWVGMFTASSGTCIYDGGAWPEKYDNMQFLSEPTVSLVHAEKLIPNGVTFKAVKEPGRETDEFMTGTDLWFRPIHTRVGPDGALYVVDLYNQAAIHNDTRGPAHGARNAATRPDRDHHFARIWRIQHKQARPLKAVKLANGGPTDWAQALNHENGWARLTAHRLLSENGPGAALASLEGMLDPQSSATALGRVHALHVLQNTASLPGEKLLLGLRDRDPLVRKAAYRIAAERDNSEFSPDEDMVRGAFDESDPRTRLLMLVALATCQPSPETANVLVENWASLQDKWSQSAALAVASADPLMFLDAAFRSRTPDKVTDLVGHIARLTGNRQNGPLAARMVRMIGSKAAATDPLKQAALEALAASLRPDVQTPWSEELAASFKALLSSSHPGLAGAVLPLIARWDSAGTMSAALAPVAATLAGKLQDEKLSDDQRGQIAANLIGVRRNVPGVIGQVSGLLGGNASVNLQRKVVEALGSAAEIEVARELIRLFPKVPFEIRELVFGALVKRVEWAQALNQALADRKIELLLLGPANIHRLRTHGDKAVAARANQVVDELKGPEQKQKEALITQLRPAVEQAGGNVARGRELYTANCAGCHVYKNEGRDLAPNLTGMGAHGPADLLVHIVDPNRVVEPNFISVSIETRDELSYDGVVARENAAELVLRNATGDFTVRKDNIKSRSSTGRSLMPEGFEALGPEGLRDMIAYLCADEARYRILDMTGAFTANSSRGIYISEEARDQTLRFRKFGIIKAGEIPFEIISPAKSPTGNNVVVLRGGDGLARTFPKKVEFAAGVKATKMHVLGGVGGWAWPFGGDDNKGKPAGKMVVHYKNGTTGEFILKNGVELADYNGRFDVPGSREVPDLLHHGQVRWFTVTLDSNSVVDRISLESFEGQVAPTFVAVTLEKVAD